MAEHEPSPAADAPPAEGEAPAKKGPNIKKIVLIAIVPLLLILGGAGAYFAGLFDSKPAEGEESAALQAPEQEGAAGKDEAAGAAVYYALPEMIVNLQAERSRPVFLKLTMSLELTKAEDTAAVDKVLPRIVDNFQIYLRELRVDDLRGSAGLYRLREELLLRVQQAVQPVRVRDVLFKEMLIQ